MIIIGLILTLCSCNEGEHNREGSDSDIHADEIKGNKVESNLEFNSLKSYRSEFIMEDGANLDGYYENRMKFIRPYVSVKYFGDTLLKVSTLHEVNTCGETVACIKFSNDTLFLLTKHVGNEMCTSVEFRKYYYVVRKDNIVDYVIMY